MRLYIAPYRLGSESAKTLAQSLGALCTQGNKGYAYPSVFINWGNSNLTVRGRGVRKIINSPRAVAIAANKHSSFEVFTRMGVPTVEYTTDQNKAKGWLEVDGLVYGRKILNGSQGVGIKILTHDEAWSSCPLYTRAMINSVHEYRVHVGGGSILDFTRKRRREGNENVNSYVRNFEHGWVFCRQDEMIPPVVKASALMAVASLGLDFGACDIVYNHMENKVAVLEVNTAPGIEGTSLNKYIEYFRRCT